MKPLVAACFKMEMYDNIKVGSTYFLGKIVKKGSGITFNKIVKCDQLYHPTERRIAEGKEEVTPRLKIEEAALQNRRNATISAIVKQVKKQILYR